MFFICVDPIRSADVGAFIKSPLVLVGPTITGMRTLYSRSKVIRVETFERTVISWLVKPVWVMISVTGKVGTSMLKLPVPSVTTPFEVPLTETETPVRDESLSVLFTLPVITCCACDDKPARISRRKNRRFLIKKCLSNDRL